MNPALIRERYLLSQWRAERMADGRRWRLERAPAGLAELYAEIRARRRAIGQEETNARPLPPTSWAPLPEAAEPEPAEERAQRLTMARTLVTQTLVPVLEIARRCGWRTATAVTTLIQREGLRRPQATQGADGAAQARVIRRYECV